MDKATVVAINALWTRFKTRVFFVLQTYTNKIYQLSEFYNYNFVNHYKNNLFILIISKKKLFKPLIKNTRKKTTDNSGLCRQYFSTFKTTTR